MSSETVLLEEPSSCSKSLLKNEFGLEISKLINCLNDYFHDENENLKINLNQWKFGGSKWKTIKLADVPSWIPTNRYIGQGYRPPLKRMSLCLWSIFRWHNETTNIWSHLIGLLIIVYISIYNCPKEQLTLQDHIGYQSHLLGMIISYLCSTLFHTFSCHSHSIGSICVRLDYFGISCQIFGNLISLFYFLNYCSPSLMLALSTVLFISAAKISQSQLFNENDFYARFLRSFIFTLFASLSILPCIILFNNRSFYLANGWYEINLVLAKFVIMLGTYFCGMIIYAMQFPEKFHYFQMNSRWNQFVYSHPIFHVFVVLASLMLNSLINDIVKYKDMIKFHCDN